MKPYEFHVSVLCLHESRDSCTYPTHTSGEGLNEIFRHDEIVRCAGCGRRKKEEEFMTQDKKERRVVKTQNHENMW